MNNRNLAYDYEREREALIAFLRVESPWSVMRIEQLERGCPLSIDDRHIIDGLRAAYRVAA